MSPEPSEQMLTIGRLSRATGASLRSIRHYDEHGLVTSVRARNGYRMFPRVAIAQVRQIQRMIATGFNLAEIRTFPECMRKIEGARSCAEAGAVQRKRLAVIERQIAELELRRARLLKSLADGVIPPPGRGPSPLAA